MDLTNTELKNLKYLESYGIYGMIFLSDGFCIKGSGDVTHLVVATYILKMLAITRCVTSSDPVMQKTSERN